MRGTVAKTFMYPIKGMHGVEMTETGIWADTQVGVRGDRNFAIYRKPSGAPAEWRPKGQFWVCMNREGMATDCGLTEDDVDVMSGRLDPEFVRGLLMGRDLPEGYTLVDTDGDWHMADTNKPCVSFLNLASVRWLEHAIGVPINPHRFRMNVWVEGFDPWVELDYVQGFEEGEKHPMWVKDNRLLIDDLCERCKAVEQNPETGKWDIELLRHIEIALKDRGYGGSPHRGKFEVMGWLAIPQSNHRIVPGDAVVFSHTVPVSV